MNGVVCVILIKLKIDQNLWNYCVLMCFDTGFPGKEPVHVSYAKLECFLKAKKNIFCDSNPIFE